MRDIITCLLQESKLGYSPYIHNISHKYGKGYLMARILMSWRQLSTERRFRFFKLDLKMLNYQLEVYTKEIKVSISMRTHTPHRI